VTARVVIVTTDTAATEAHIEDAEVTVVIDHAGEIVADPEETAPDLETVNSGADHGVETVRKLINLRKSSFEHPNFSMCNTLFFTKMTTVRY